MKIKIQDILKEARSLTIAGIVIVFLWLALLPAYTNTVYNKAAIRHLIAYVTLRDMFTDDFTGIRFAINYEAKPIRTIPTIPNGLNNWPIDTQGIAKCKAVEPPATAASDCSRLVQSSQYFNGTLAFSFTPIELNSELQKTDELGARWRQVFSMYIPSVENYDAYPFSEYILVLGPRTAWPGSSRNKTNPPIEKHQSERAKAPTIINSPTCNAAYAGNIDIEAVNNCFDMYIAQRGTNHSTRDGQSAILTRLFGDTPNYAEAEPLLWNRSRRLLAQAGMSNPQLHNISISSPELEKVVEEHLYADPISDVAGIKVPSSSIPLTIATLLSSITCLLYGCFATIKNAKTEDVSDDVGWILMSNTDFHGKRTVLVAFALIAMNCAALLYAINTTHASIRNFVGITVLAPLAVLISIVLFSYVCLRLALAQHRLSRSVAIEASRVKVKNGMLY